ncbi:MAG: undecaprenyl/decaprenyl-phosphate alpha-N-acetylglucosaminyl 1-phosphate transferase [Sphingobacteriaceae bacterium]|nr:MAG: undecaprenyl/decaprenyl-phosphate alpha-N-acetylglucosaminyl 1-phosphate transferase [Sphingobacteriaceae bacterium]
MMFQEIYFLLITCVSVLLVLLIMPSVIHIAQKNNLFDDHSLSRKEHGYGIPRLGGVAFFTSTILTSFFIVKNGTDLPMYQLYAASLILFGIGIKDDLTGVHFHTKLIVQAVVAFIITVSADIRLTSLHGIFQVYQLDTMSSVLISMLLIMFIINAFNLIDGIDGLAGTLALIACSTFGFYFVAMHQFILAALAFSVAGSVCAFLIYNFSPAKIFMGDAGSMFLGLICAVFTFKFISVNEASAISNMRNAPVLAVSVLIIPAFDMLNVIATRIYHKKSPFKPDRNHIHHRMLHLGLTHLQTTLILGAVTIGFITMSSLLVNINTSFMLILFSAILLLLNGLVNGLVRVKVRTQYPVTV